MMKRVLLCLVFLVSLSSWAWSFGWGILNFPSYVNSAKDACDKFDVDRNGALEYVFDMQKEPPLPFGQSKFREELAKWDASVDNRNSRGSMQVMWKRTLTQSPHQGWPVIRVGPTVEEMMATWPLMVPD